MPRRPPKKWFDKMKRKAKKQYPSYSEKRINKIVAGIWYDYKPSTRRRILKKYEGGGKVGKKKKTYKKKSTAKKAKRKGESLYKVKGGWRISRK